MIYPNKPARTYEFFIENIATLTRTDLVAISSASIGTFTWGNAFSATHGFKITLHTYFNVGSATGHTEVKLDGPWGSSMAIADPLSITADIRSKLVFVNAVLTRGSDCGWSLTFDEIQWYTDIGNTGTWTLQETIAGRTDTGAGYDGRLNVWKIQSQSTCGVAPVSVPAIPVCAGSYAAETTFAYDALTSTLGDWRWDEGSGWVLPDFDILSISPPAPVVPGGCPGCDCILGLPPITVGTTYPRIGLSSEVIVTKVKADLGRITCHCPPGTIEAQPGLFDVWTITVTYQNQQSQIESLPKDAGITKSEKDGGARCWCVDPAPSYTTSSLTSVDPDTACAYLLQSSQVINKSMCWHLVQLGNCALPEDGGSVGISSPCIDPTTACAYDGYVQLLHPDAPPCTATVGSQPWHLQREDGWSHWAVVDTTGNVWVKTSDYVGPTGVWRTAIQVTSSADCSRPRLRFDPLTSRLTLTYMRSGIGPYTAFSDDDGASFSTPGAW